MDLQPDPVRLTSSAPSPDEYEELTHFNPDHAEYVMINWCLGNTCNYSCSYCPEWLHSGANSWPSLEDVIRFVDQVFAHYGNRKKFFFELTGGEISLYKDLPKLLLHLREKGARVGLISNGARSLDFWRKIQPNVHQVCLSFHPESAKSDHFLAVVRLLSETMRTHVNVMMSPDHFETCRSLSEEVVKIPNISITLQPLIFDLAGDLYPYSEEQKNFMSVQQRALEKSIQFTKSFEGYRGDMLCKGSSGRQFQVASHSFVSSNHHRWKGWTCYAGVEQFVVAMNGEIFRGWCKVGGPIGHIKDSKLRLPKNPVLCSRSECHCNFDITCTKVKKPRKKLFGFF